MYLRGMIAVLALLISLALVSVADARPYGRAVGPRLVHPGQKVRYRAHGFEPGTDVEVTIQPRKCLGSNGCAVGARPRWRTTSTGSVRVSFRFPRHYNMCAGPECYAHPNFRKGSWAQVQLCDIQWLEGEAQRYLACASKMVRIR